MTERLDDDMPAKIWVVPSDEKSGEYDVNRFCECLDCQLCRTTQRYVHTDLYTAVVAERDALRALCEWQPIETAPMDGVFLVYDAEAKMAYVAVNTTHHDKLMSNVYAFATFTNCHYLKREAVTHWMPLPRPPAVALTAYEKHKGVG